MSANPQPAGDLARGSLVPSWLKDAGRTVLDPVVRLALRLRLTPNTVTVLGLLLTLLAATLIASGSLLVGAAILTVGSLLDAVDGALARARGGGTAFGGFLDSTLDRAGEAILYMGVAGYYLRTAPDPTLPVLAAFVALSGSFMVSYSRARAEGVGFHASVGLAPRTERLVLIIVGIALAGLGLGAALIGAITIIAALTVATLIQRIWHVWRLAEQPRIAPATGERAEENVPRG
jgi:CDP-diacylglycerol--glycerol-3-phosphate 3-phosphatidyltransferase